MRIQQEQIDALNRQQDSFHRQQLDGLRTLYEEKRMAQTIQKLADFQVALPSWALGAGGTRFGRFSYGGEPGNLEQKIEDIGLIHQLTRTAGAVSLHIPWDIPEDVAAIRQLADELGISFDAMNSNTFQDQAGAGESYRNGSLSSVHRAAREQAIAHNIEVIRIGEQLGSKSLTVWLADGASFPGQYNFQTVLQHTEDSLKHIYSELPDDWKLLIEYKPYEPHFYSTVIQDWGTSFALANACGEKAFTLVDLGHHLPNTNIEQIVATLMKKGKLGGFHFNDSKYGDDDLTVGAIKPYNLFLIFNELVYGMENNPQNPDLAWMIDASHNIKDPLEDLIQSLEAILIAYAQALLVDRNALFTAQQESDVVRCQEILQHAYRTDVRPLLREARLRAGGAFDPLETYRSLEVRKQLVKERGSSTRATGL
ncbi:TIM barrel protein [Sinomicrobium soli]|uniref:TIM barrel protein n=1 Tax=Sinomicrobium sp. N-1-3-6 TaxID=2219864 RepID=UPI000DCD440F|nr:TIM barrel protein [Sinomicrobium sp. N-1-3-6]RAV28130.1 sugar isomerase [Sinomicrobium sp. N-1-3-6]